ncbi:Cof-type HAD-IIB family hydrolase [uncultured Eubacterium sp.]|uniref:Cof-type HAD-IIB family hydrolase n=1 Tax=uncultured Eubacterium sp. TaxID=165185 RepID=UPI0025997DDB|nr:Cof-type HAD-IIB family hydrolase [uncultured Eubacterium sp.]
MNLAGKNIKCIAFDLDHTVINSDGTMSDATRTVIGQAIAEGIEIVPVSGRAFATFPESIGQIEGISYAVTSNGAAIYNKKTGERIHGVAIESEDLHSILDAFAPYFEKAQIAYEAFVDGVAYGGRAYVEHPEAFGVPERNVAYVQSTRKPVDDILAFLSEHEEELDSLDIVAVNPVLYQEIEDQIPRITKAVYVTSAVSYRLEISHKDSGKAAGLAYVLDLLGIAPEETIAFGDGDNDAEMLAFAGLGVAMENATEKCKAAADAVCDRCENDGVARFLYGF